MSTTTGTIDPITFEVVRNAFMSVVDEMGLMLERVGHSLVVSEGRDFSAAICDPDGRMVAEGKEDLPAHVGTLPHTVKAVISWIGRDRIDEGDIFIMNDAFLGGTHCQDVRTIMPVFRDGELLAFVQNSAHWSDAGGPVPGSFHAEAASTYGEALYIPPIHLVREGELDDEVMRLILRNVRVPETTQGDVFAQIAACRTGEQRLQALIDKYGVGLIRAEMAELIRYSEALLREEFRRIPDGTYSFEDAIDFDPMGDRETPVKIRVEITIEGDRATYDLSLGRLAKRYESRAADADESDADRADAKAKADLTAAVRQWITGLVASVPVSGADGKVPLQTVVSGALEFLEHTTARHSALDHRAAAALLDHVGELRALGAFACGLAEALRFIRERVHSRHVAPERPRPFPVHNGQHPNSRARIIFAVHPRNRIKVRKLPQEQNPKQ